MTNKTSPAKLKKILVADDSQTMRAILSKKIEEMGYDVIVAKDGLDALNAFYNHDPDLVVLDVLMPVLNGYHACRLIKNDPAGRSIPVIMLTAEEQPRDKFWGQQTGVNLYVVKDGKWAALEKGIKSLLEINPRVGSSDPKSGSAENDGSSTTQILTRLNSLLDKQLFQATFRNEIAKIFTALEDYELIFEKIFSLLKEVISFDVAAIFMVNPNGSSELVYMPTLAISQDSFDDIQKKVLKLVNTGVKTFNQKEIKERNLGVKIDPKLNDSNLTNIKAFSLQTAGTVFGSLILINKPENKFQESDLDNIELVMGDFSILLDNARLHNSIKLLSIIDGLTNVFNHRHFQDLLAIEFDRAVRYKLNLSMVMLDIDHFKKFNDTYGHQQGDVILKGVAQIIKDQCRHIDFVARYGGEEFAVIMPETDLNGATILCERIRKALEKHGFPGLQGTLNVTASLGVTEIHEQKAASAAEIIKQADTALYVAKESGRNRLAIYSPDMADNGK